MRKLIYWTSISLDGFIARPNGDLDWVIIDEELHKYINAQQRQLGCYVYGRRMYEQMAAFWPTADADASAPDFIAEYAEIWRQMPKVVFSHSLEQVEWNARLARGDVGTELAKLKSEPGKDLSVGGADLAATVMRLGLVDEYYLYLNPVVLGSGIRPFPPLERTVDLKLRETHLFGSGVIFLRYERAAGGQHV